MDAKAEIQKDVAELAKTFPKSSFLLYALGLKLHTMDYAEIFRDAVLDGSDDKKVDFFIIDREAGTALIGQDYQSPNWGKEAPPSNKAADLNTAVSWILDADIASLPAPLQAKSEELRDALKEGDIHTIEVTYVHNLPHSQNVRDELKTVQAALQTKLDNWPRQTDTPLVGIATESGLDAVLAWRAERDTPIRVTDEVVLTCSTDPQEAQAELWRSIFANVSGDQLVALVEAHGDDIYSANVRNYLGTRSSARNINSQIVQTATEQPTNFWVFNNGITGISRSIELGQKQIRCKGFAIINGAQTLGSLFDARAKSDLKKVSLLLRVVESNDPDFIQDVIRFNNTQNPIKAWELRAIDRIQTRIKQEFVDRFELTYQLRRGVTRWSADEILFEKLGPWLSAFYGDPETAHRNRPVLFDNDGKYNALFNDATDISNLLFVYRLGQAVGAVKDDIRAKIDAGSATDAENTHYSYFRFGAFTYALIFLCSEALRAIVNSKGADFKVRITLVEDLLKKPEKAVSMLKPLVEIVLKPLPSSLKDKDPYAVFKSLDGVNALAASILVTLEQLLVVQPDALDYLKAVIRVAE